MAASSPWLGLKDDLEVLTFEPLAKVIK